MNNITRRNFIEKSVVLSAAGLVTPSVLNAASTMATPRMIKDDISLAQWALVDEIKAGKWKNLDFPKIQEMISGLMVLNSSAHYLNCRRRVT